MPTRTLAPVLHYLRRIEAESHERRDTDGDLLARFVRTGDESAFATLLKRHGPAVYGVCRRVLRDRHEAEDALQATFLVLVRKAASLRQPERLGCWLHGVAYRTALKARSRVTRHATDALVGDIPAPATDEAAGRELRAALDRAIDALPAKYRVPFVLCHLQGLTNLQAARQLGCPEGTVATRLSRARQRLRGRLARHGLAVAALGALDTGAASLSAAVPSLLFVSTLRIATAYRLGAATVPATVAALTEGVGQTMFMTKLHFLLALVALVGTAVGGTALWTLGAQEPPPAPVVQPPIVLNEPPPRASGPAPVPVPAPLAPTAATTAIVRTDNFIVNAPSRRIAQLVADAAERLRKSEAIRWFGKELPPWSEPCAVLVKSEVGRGHATTFQFRNTRVIHREMILEGTLDQVLANGLPHEITHAILADQFGIPVPRWADEGAAMQAEDADGQQYRKAHMYELLDQANRRIALHDLLRTKEYPKERKVFYAESYSLTRFLIERKDRKTFLAFVAQGTNGDAWDEAVKEHYAFATVAALQETWLARVAKERDEERVRTGTQKLTAIKGLPPTFGRASIDADGRLVLRTASVYYEPVTRYDYDNNRKVAMPVTSYEMKVAEQAAHYDVREVTATDLAGKPIDAKTLAKRLEKETAVLIGQFGQTVDPYYLAVVREGTIILGLRQPVPVPATPVPPSVSDAVPRP
jgi:RNA polymerase sigma factor (sigma-70 family)